MNNTLQFPGTVAGASSSQPRRTPTGLPNRQKALLHIYKQCAGLSEGEYRQILRRSAHVGSAADPYFSQPGFERAMAAIEAELASRVESGRVPQPPRRHVPRLDYWRSKLPRTGQINIRQSRSIEQLWSVLCQSLGSAATQEYLMGIIHKATGRRVGIHQLRATEAGMLIDALKSRISTALAAPKPKEEIPCPF